MKKNRNKKDNLMGWNETVPTIEVQLFAKGFGAFCDAAMSEAQPERKTLGNPITLIEDDGSESVIQIVVQPVRTRRLCAERCSW